jgi:hypothetical protein
VTQVLNNANKYRMMNAQLEADELNTQVCDEVKQMIANIPYQPSKLLYLI